MAFALHSLHAIRRQVWGGKKTWKKETSNGGQLSMHLWATSGYSAPLLCTTLLSRESLELSKNRFRAKSRVALR